MGLGLTKSSAIVRQQTITLCSQIGCLTISLVFCVRVSGRMLCPSEENLFLHPAGKKCSDNSVWEMWCQGRNNTADIPDPYARMPRGQKVSPHYRAAGKYTSWFLHPRFSARTSMTRRVHENQCAEKVCIDICDL